MDNPIQLEIIKNALNRIGEEMAIAIIRAAYFTFIKEMADMSCAIFDYEARLVAQSGAPLLHLSSLRPSLRELMKDFPPEQMKEGDVYLFNDPFRGGIHSNDIMVIRPVFYKGQLTFFTCALIHVSDLGGVSAGGLPANATECYHEGLMLPPVKLYDGGQLNQDLVRIIRANSRTPDKVMGDINAMAGGNNFAARKMTELLDKHGRDKLLHYVNQLIEYTERRTRQEIEKIPDGVYQGEYVVEEDGVDLGKTFKVKATVTIEGSTCHVDFTGTDPQARGPINAAYSQSTSGVITALRCIIDHSIPMNEGCFLPIKVTLPEGTLVNPRRPAACNARVAVVQAVIDAIHRALAAPYREKVAGCAGTTHVYTVGGVDPDNGNWNYMDAIVGAMGATFGNDGPDNGIHPIYSTGDGYGASMEAYETELPILYRGYGIWNDSGGPGKWRGGCGTWREVEFLQPSLLTVRASDRCKLPPPGVEGGKTGKGGSWFINLGKPTQALLPTKKTNHPVEPGDVLTMFTSGGGGYGDPFERDPELVARDVKQKLVSVESAARDYGVIVNPVTGTVDSGATARLRR